MADKQQRAAFLRHVPHFTKAFLLERRITDGEHFINNHDLRLQVSRYCKSQPNMHSAAVVFNWGVEKGLNLCKGDDFVELAADLRMSYAEDSAIEIDVLPSCELGMKAGTYFE